MGKAFICWFLLLHKQDGSCSQLLRDVGMKAPRPCCWFPSPLLPVFRPSPQEERASTESHGCPFRAPESADAPQISALLTASRSQGTCCLMEAGPRSYTYPTWSGVGEQACSCSLTSGSPSGSQLGPGSVEPRMPSLACERCRECSQPGSSQASERAQQLAGRSEGATRAEVGQWHRR